VKILCLQGWNSVVGGVKPGTQILHSRADDVVPFESSVELLSKSGLPESALIEAGGANRSPVWSVGCWAGQGAGHGYRPTEPGTAIVARTEAL
jgi:hypothetical protein